MEKLQLANQQKKASKQLLFKGFYFLKTVLPEFTSWC